LESIRPVNVSVKGEYALQAIFDLASQPGREPVKIADIARSQQIPQKFLELILASLKQGGFVESRRGAEGGYLLAKRADAITVGDVLRFVEGRRDERSRIRRESDSPLGELWDRADAAVNDSRLRHFCATGPRMDREAQPLRTELGDLNVLRRQFLSIGRTPLVRLNRVIDGAPVTMLGKVEGPQSGVFGKVPDWRIHDLGRRRSAALLKPGKELIEPTSGNTGIALAFVAAARGYPVTLTMPETMSLERRKVLSVFGAKLELTEGAKGMGGAIAKAQEIVQSDPDRYVLLQQFDNPANPAIHEKTTGPEIWDDTEGKIDVLVAGVGTGGTITGVSRYIKHQRGKPITSVAVEPVASPVISQTMAGQPQSPGRIRFRESARDSYLAISTSSMVDRVEKVTNEESIEMARRLAREEGLLCGISCGAAVAAAVRIAREEEFRGKTIVVVLPDSGERYLSSCSFRGHVRNLDQIFIGRA
jgi:cysteine synthase A